jgi:hypothetical protein
MKNSLIIIFVILNIIAAINCYSIEGKELNREKRSDDEGFFSKIKTGVTNFGSKTKKFFVKGYEETKNLFSSDRKVGDYTLGEIDVRFDGEDDEDDNSTTIAPRTKRDSQKIPEIIKESRNVLEDDVDHQEGEEGIVFHDFTTNKYFS